MNTLDKIRGCLLGGAVGDTLGSAVEFMAWCDIREKYGPEGITEYDTAYKGEVGHITDDTQMTLFTAEAIIQCHLMLPRHPFNMLVSKMTHQALRRWYVTQLPKVITLPGPAQGWLVTQKELHAKRAPGNTCLESLKRVTKFGIPIDNDSKGCGGVMRVAPYAFTPYAHYYASMNARLTHGHMAGYFSAGVFASILYAVVQGDTLLDAIIQEVESHVEQTCPEVTNALKHVLEFHRRAYRPTPERINEFGGGWVAEEALAIGLWCALFADSFRDGVVMAVNHSGDSDSTGSITGNVLGVIFGPEAIDEHWINQLKTKHIVERMSADLHWAINEHTQSCDTATKKAFFNRYMH